MGSLDADGDAVLFEGSLRGLDDANYSETVLCIGKRRRPANHTLDEMLALELQRLCCFHAWNQNIAEPHLDRLTVTRCWWSFRVIVINTKLFRRLHVIENGHFVPANNSRLANLVRVEPAQVDVRHDSILEEQTYEHYVFDPVLDITLPSGADVRWLHLQYVQNL